MTARETGFTLRPIARQALHRRPKTLLDLECQHVLRTRACETVHGRPPLEYRLWLEAGKLDLKPPAENPNAIRCSRFVESCTVYQLQDAFLEAIGCELCASSVPDD